ncbi:recombinase family protein [Rhodobacteraceae bacterium R_SAG2]|nr:recombinase family protein [Rhodobacteraceae bacterium R_SAG2]
MDGIRPRSHQGEVGPGQKRRLGGSLSRPNFIRALKFAQHPGTEFVVWKLDRLGRTLEGVISVLNLFEQRGCHGI